MAIEVRLNTNPHTMISEVRRFAKEMEPIVTTITHNIMLYCGNSKKDWLFRQSRTGGNSFSLTDYFNEYHFRYQHNGEIVVYDRYFHGEVQPIARIRTRKQAAKFVRTTVKGF